MLAPGSVLGNYCIVRAVGSGGMGEVYRARHVVLGRDVALKTLPPDRVHDPDRIRRFITEARAASALNHPNIASLYDIDQADACHFIAMEYVDGKTLREVIGSTGLPPERAVRYAKQIADALAAAHSAGIIHRDVKPANVMVSRSNAVKMVDFGLAKLFDTEDDADLSSTRTLLGDESEYGPRSEVCGTAAYMSPEQAQGARIDHRTDIFSFGIVLYQMLTGRFPFWGPTSQAVRAAIVNTQPTAVRDLSPAVPRELEDVVQLCLKKDPEQRFQSMRDVVHVLEIVERNLERHQAPPARPESWTRRLIVPALSVAFLALALAGAWLWMGRDFDAVQRPVLRRLTWDAALSEAPALSTDGNWVAFGSDRGKRGNLDIWIEAINTGELKALTQDPADDTDPSFSPDGTRIVFHSDRDGGGIYSIPSLGGAERLLARYGRRPRYSPNGQQIVYWIGDRQGRLPTGRLFLLPAGGGQPRALRADFADAHDPIWMADGKHILFEGSRSHDLSDLDWWVTPVDDGTPVRTGAAAVISKAGLISYPPGGWRNGRVVFSGRAENTRGLYELPISVRTWNVSGTPQRLTFGTAADGEPFPLFDGRVVFQSSSSTVNLWAMPMRTDGASGGEIRRITEGSSYHWSPSASADGVRVVFSAGRLGSRDVWIKDLTTGQQNVFVSSPLDECSPVIDDGGSRVAYSICGSSKKPMHIVRVSDRLEPIDADKVCDDCGEPNDWSADGTRILFVSGAPNLIGVFDLTSRRASTILSSGRGVDQPRFSPDGKWIAFSEQTESGRTRIVVTPATAGGVTIPITDGRDWDSRPVWAPDGNTVLFQSQRDGFTCLWRQSLDAVTKAPRGLRVAVRHFHTASASLSGLFVTLSGMWASRQQLIFNLYEGTGNIWMLEDGKSSTGTARAAVPAAIFSCRRCTNRL